MRLNELEKLLVQLSRAVERRRCAQCEKKWMGVESLRRGRKVNGVFKYCYSEQG